MKTTKQMICIFLALTFALLVGCKDNSLPVDEVIAESELYDVVRSDMDYYILNHNEQKDNDSSIGEAGVKFKSINDMRTAILENKITASDIQNIRSINHLKADEPIKLFDLNKMYCPSSPYIIEYDKAVWYGPYYIVKFIATDEKGDKLSGSGGTDTQAEFEQAYNKRFVEDLEALGDKYVVTQLTDRNATEYRSDYDRYVVYTIEESGRKISVMERYNFAGAHDDFSEEVPWIVYVHVEANGLYYSYGFIDFSTRPTKEWLLSFGMKPYVPEETE